MKPALPRIAVTMGDPAGIGPEVILKTLADPQIHQICHPLVVGDLRVLERLRQEYNLDLSLIRIQGPQDPRLSHPDAIPVLDLSLVSPDTLRWGTPSPETGRAAVAYIREATRMALAREVEALCTAPISKAWIQAAGYPFPGHTEMLAQWSGVSEFGMMMVGGGLRILLTTIHVALAQVPQILTPDRILRAIRLAHQAMEYFPYPGPKPRIGVAALNPHAGERGLFGDEEERLVAPACRTAREEGLQVSDPLPADTLFHRALQGEFDAVVALYHDQALIPIKVLAFGRAVNLTVGLPFIRTSVDHGTAFEIAGKNLADPGSLREALLLAARMWHHRHG